MSSIRAGTFRPDQSRSGMVIVADSAIPLNPSDSSFEALNAAPAPHAQAPECLGEDGHQEDGPAGESAANSSECAPRSCGALSSLEDESSSSSDSAGERSGDEVVYEDLGPKDSLCKVAPRPLADSPDLEVWQNTKTKSLHTRARGAAVLACGRSFQGMSLFTGCSGVPGSASNAPLPSPFVTAARRHA